MTDIYYVYQYTKEDGLPFYIGMGKGSRINDPHKNLKIPKKEYRKFVAIKLSEFEALMLERKLTEFYGLKSKGGILENKIHGGHASPRGMLNKKHTNETKLKISLGNKGKIRSEEQKNNYRKPKSKEHAEKIRIANLGRPDDGRGKKAGLKKSKHKWYNNGSITKMFEPGNQPPEFILGRKIREN